MRERPILFAGSMVRAIREDRKTNTRRVVIPQPPPECGIHYMLGDESWLPPEQRKPLRHTWEAWGGPLFHAKPPEALCGIFDVTCPYGAPGDRLWVREAWRACREYDATKPSELPTTAPVWYEAGPTGNHQALGFGKLRPGMFMPRWACRLVLELTNVRVERLNACTPEDAMAEGWPGPDPSVSDDPEVHRDAARDWFMDLWDSINGKRPGCAWADNPLVWVLSFRRLDDAATSEKEAA